MTTTYKGRPLELGERIPNTALRFVGTVLPRRGEFLCDCGKTKVYNMIDVERGHRKTCGCGCVRKKHNFGRKRPIKED